MPKVWAIIPARGGSKRIPGKNLQRIGRKTLIEIAVEQARAARLVDVIAVSSEDEEILAHAEKLGVRAIRRPAALARDETPGMAPVLHAIHALKMREEEELVLLQPTSPFRAAEDIDGAILRRRETGAPACVSVAPVQDHPGWMYRLDEAGRLMAFTDGELHSRSQDLPALYVLNGAVYVAQIRHLQRHETFLAPRTVAHVMPRERSLDIDTPFDLQMARALASWRENRKDQENRE